MAAHELLYNVNEAWIALCFFIIILIETHLCYRFGVRRQYKHTDKTTQILVGFMPGALVTLLALFYAFVVSMAEVRFEDRRQYLVDEANSIEMAYLRSKALPEVETSQIAPLLREYVEKRIQFYGDERETEEIASIRSHVDRLQAQLWQHASSLSKSHPESVPVGQFADALNQSYMNRERQTEAYENHVPDVIILLLLWVSCLVMASVGYAAGVSGGKHMVSTLALSLILALTLFAILDIDRPRGGFASLNYDSLIRVQDKIKGDMS